MPGPPKKPTVLKKLAGNPGHRPLPTHEPEGVGEIWDPPSWFAADQRREWTYAVAHAPHGLLTGSDRAVLETFCVARCEWRKAMASVRKHGQVIQTKSGNVIQNPSLGAANRAAMVVLKTGSLLGFNPSARATLGDRVPEFRNGPAGARGASEIEAYLSEKPDELT